MTRKVGGGAQFWKAGGGDCVAEINEEFLQGLRLNRGGSGLGQPQAGCQCVNWVGPGNLHGGWNSFAQIPSFHILGEESETVAYRGKEQRGAFLQCLSPKS